jgi:nucleotide-binding universal stress UspA family protein
MTTNPDTKEMRAQEIGESPFARVLVGVDGGKSSFEACRQAARLADPPPTPIDLIAVVHVAEAARAGHTSSRFADQLQADAEHALNEAVRIVGERARPRLVDGLVTATLLHEIQRLDATMIAVGTHGHRRITEILIGGVAGELLHLAPCSVLVARAPATPERFPSSLLVGLDGSSGSEYALATAELLAARRQIPLRAIAATRDDHVDLTRVRDRFPAAEEIDARPIDTLVTASRAADLLVVGSRGLRGIRALGSVSERVSHQAACSVLIARPCPLA